MNDILCNYGCGQEALYQFKNGKWCCSKKPSSCLESKRKNKERNIGRKHSIETKEKMSMSRKGLKNGMYGKHHSIESINLIKKKTKELTPKGKKHYLFGKKISNFTKNKMSNFRKGKRIEEIIGNEKGKKFRENNRKIMLNGQALKMIKCIKKISKEEIRLREMVKQLYPECQYQYLVLNFSLDVALPDLKIAIEYDGYYHFDTEEHKQYHKLRQEKIEKEGWKFIRYTMFDKFPVLNELKENIQKIIRKDY